jgi:hypothetical protein
MPADGNIGDVDAWIKLQKKLEADARKVMPPEEVADAVMDAMGRCFRKKIQPSEVDRARDELRTVNTTERRRRQRQAALPKPTAPKGKLSPSKGVALEGNAPFAQKVEIARAAAREEIGKRYRKTLIAFNGWSRESPARRAELNEAVESYLVKLEKKVCRHTSASDLPREFQLLISPEYATRTDLELSQYAALAGILRESDTVGRCTGREIIRRVFQRLRAWRGVRPLLKFAATPH